LRRYIADDFVLQNTEYLVVSGAKKKMEEWVPEENGTLTLKGEHLADNYVRGKTWESFE
jgi:hypothetical protein